MASGGSGRATRRASVLVRYLDVVLLAIATPVALALGAPALGFLVGAGAWLLQRVLAEADRRWIRRAQSPGRSSG